MKWIRDKLPPCLFPIITLSFVISGSVHADSVGESGILVRIDGEQLQCQQAPVIVNGNTLVPLRALFEALGARVDWNASTQTVTAYKADATVRLSIGNPIAYKNKEEIKLDVPASIINETTMVPTRFIAESLGSTVNWNATTRTVDINVPQPTPKLDSTNEITLDAVRPTGTSILGDPISEPEELYAFASKYNPQIPVELSQLYVELGKVYHIRGDLAFIQMCKETNFYRFGGDVKPGQNNLAGIGTTGNGEKGNQFASLEEGVQAHLQHLYAYATSAPLPASEPLIDPRFNLVKRGIAPTWEQLGGRWATSIHYGEEIVSLYQRMKNYHKS